MKREGLVVALALTLASFTSSCRFQGIEMIRDDRIRIVEPRDREEVDPPFVVRWTADDVPADRRFAVVVDGPVQPPGARLDWYARDDPFCSKASGCPDLDYLRRSGIFVTTAMSVRIPGLLDRTDVAPARRRHHEITVVLLDTDGRRVGEVGSFVEFRTKRRP